MSGTTQSDFHEEEVQSELCVFTFTYQHRTVQKEFACGTLVKALLDFCVKQFQLADTKVWRLLSKHGLVVLDVYENTIQEVWDVTNTIDLKVLEDLVQQSITENPFLRYYLKYEFREDPEERVKFFTELVKTATKNLSQRGFDDKGFKNQATLRKSLTDENKWPKKVNELYKRISKACLPSYAVWEGKKPITFPEFCDMLDNFYWSLEVRSTRDADHFFRRSTNPYRKKNKIKKTTAWKDIKETVDLENREHLTTMVTNYNAVTKKNKTLNFGDDDAVQVDHVLSCQVFHTLVKKICNANYSYDRFYSWKIWLNKCWNFQILPSKVNNLKGKVEQQIIKILLEQQPTEEEKALLKAYFENVCYFLEKYSKKNSLKQTQVFKTAFKEFLQDLDLSYTGVDEYKCDANCYCNTKNASLRMRLQTYHLFVDPSEAAAGGIEAVQKVFQNAEAVIST